MNITVIYGSPRKNGCSHTAARLFLSAMEGCGDISVTEFYLPADLPEFCHGCMRCVLDGEAACPHAQYTLPILQAMLAADALVFTTPVFVMAESGSIKNFLDHYAHLFIVHRAREEMFGKKAFVLCTTLGAGTKHARKTIKTSLRFWGVNRVYSAGFALQQVDWANMKPARRQKIERKLQAHGAKFYQETASKKRHKPYLFLRFLVFFLRRMVPTYQDDMLDKQYWVEKGWLKKSPFA